jgi:hypothetical protein
LAHSQTPRNRCVRFVFGVTAASRNTRFQAARYDLTWAGPTSASNFNRVYSFGRLKAHIEPQRLFPAPSTRQTPRDGTQDVGGSIPSPPTTGSDSTPVGW